MHFGWIGAVNQMLVIAVDAVESQVHRAVESGVLTSDALLVEFRVPPEAERRCVALNQATNARFELCVVWISVHHDSYRTAPVEQRLDDPAQPNRRRWPTRVECAELAPAVVKQFDVADPRRDDPERLAGSQQLADKERLEKVAWNIARVGSGYISAWRVTVHLGMLPQYERHRERLPDPLHPLNGREELEEADIDGFGEQPL